MDGGDVISENYLYSFQGRKEKITFNFCVFITITTMYRVLTY